jgi:glycosyltransferase involved in cell wall biosynthesis
VLPRWKSLQWLQRALCRRAAATLVTNEHVGGLVRSAGGDAVLVPDVPVLFPRSRRLPRAAVFTVVVVCSFDVDEPLDAVIAAARNVPDVKFFVTGDSAFLPSSIKAGLPPNMTLTGFLTLDDYGTMIGSADAVMDLTTHDHTMLRGAYEAIYQGVPVIVSDWPVLRDAFPFGAVHVDNTAGGIVRAIRVLQRNEASYRSEAELLRQVKTDRWQTTRLAILARLSGASTC